MAESSDGKANCKKTFFLYLFHELPHGETNYCDNVNNRQEQKLEKFFKEGIF